MAFHEIGARVKAARDGDAVSRDKRHAKNSGCNLGGYHIFQPPLSLPLSAITMQFINAYYTVQLFYYSYNYREDVIISKTCAYALSECVIIFRLDTVTKRFRMVTAVSLQVWSWSLVVTRRFSIHSFRARLMITPTSSRSWGRSRRADGGGCHGAS